MRPLRARPTPARRPATGRALPPAEARAPLILTRLSEAHPGSTTALSHANPLELLVATILSAQSTDVLVNTVTPALFARYRTAADYANAALPELERLIGRVNFFRTKARHIKAANACLVERHGGEVPRRMEDLVELPGVARKTANVVLGTAFRIASGIVVDTHVLRVSQRLGLTQQHNPVKVERDLMRLVPQERWIDFGHEMIWHGRRTCAARNPKCEVCPLGRALCPSYLTAKTAGAAGARASAKTSARRPRARRTSRA